ncbi:MAG: hypothetical protein WA738_21175 [Candidatus Angelobacter sp.]
MKKSFCCFVLVVLFMGMSVAQQFVPPPNKNAALRYWMSFADLADRPTDDATNKAIDDVLSGASAWDEQKLGPLVAANEAAVLSLQRATKLTECNWGLEYERGSAMSLGHLPKARVIARLNALYGARQLAKGDATGAVETWLAGLRFAQHAGKDVGLIGTLSAKPALMANLHLLYRAVQGGQVNAELQTKIRAQLQKLPSDGLDWTDSIRAEAWAGQAGLKDLALAQNFQETYRAFFSNPPPGAAQPPSQADINGYRNVMNEVLAAFQSPSAQTKERLTTIIAKVAGMNPAVQAVIPNYQRVNESRIQVASEEQALLKSLK